MNLDSTSVFYLLLLSACINVVTAAIKLTLPEALRRYLPLVPLVLGSIGGPLTGLTPAVTTSQAIVWGILAGAFSGQSYEVFVKIWKGWSNAASSAKPESKAPPAEIEKPAHAGVSENIEAEPKKAGLEE